MRTELPWLRAELVDELLARLDLGPSDVVFVGGSLVAGLGNERSDLDVYVVAEAEAEGEAHEAVSLGPRTADVVRVSRAAIACLAVRLLRWAADGDPKQAESFSLGTRKLMVRIATGEALYGRGGFEDLQQGFPKPLLARQKLAQAIHGARCIQVDLAGFHAARDWMSMAMSSQELLGHGVDALLAGAYELDPSPKWRTRLLQRLPLDWARGMPGGTASGPVADHVMQLHRLPDIGAGRAIWLHAHRIAHFARTVIVTAAWKLDHPAEPVPWLTLGSSSSAGRRLPRLEVDVDFACRSDDLIVGCLREHSRAFSVTPAELSALCAFDGEHTAADVAALPDGEELLERAERVVELGGMRAREEPDLEVLSSVLAPQNR